MPANLVPFLPFVIIGVGVIAVLLIVLSRRRSKAVPVDRERLLDLQNQWRAPAELLSLPVPRPVRLTVQAKLVVGFIVLFLAGAGAFAVFGVTAMERERQRAELLGREGVSGAATVVRKWSTSGKSTSYYVQYSYEVGDKLFHRRARISAGAWRRLHPGSQVAMRYAPSDPEVSRLDLESSAPSWLVLFPAVIFVVVIVLLPLPILTQRKLLQSGNPTGAIVTRVVPVKNGQSVRYQFLDMAGNEVAGSSMAAKAGAPEPGQAVTVLYDPDRPRRNTLYPPQMVRLDLPGL